MAYLSSFKGVQVCGMCRRFNSPCRELKGQHNELIVHVCGGGGGGRIIGLLSHCTLISPWPLFILVVLQLFVLLASSDLLITLDT